MASLSRVPHPRTYSKAPHAPAPRQLLKHPSRRHPAFADGPFRADTHASPRVILNLPQARHMPPRRLVMPATAGGVAFIGIPFPRPASPHLLQSATCASPPPTSQAPFPSPPRFADSPSPRGHSRSAMKTTLKLPCPRHRAISQPHQSTAFASPRQLLKHAFLRFRGRPFSAQTHAHHQESS